MTWCRLRPLNKGVMRLEEPSSGWSFEIKDSSYAIPNDPEQTTRSNGACLENVNVDPTERSLFRSWGQMNSAKNNDTDAMKILLDGNRTGAGVVFP